MIRHYHKRCLLAPMSGRHSVGNRLHHNSHPVPPKLQDSVANEQDHTRRSDDVDRPLSRGEFVSHLRTRSGLGCFSTTLPLQAPMQPPAEIPLAGSARGAAPLHIPGKSHTADGAPKASSLSSGRALSMSRPTPSYSPHAVRTLGIVAHIDAGKTTTTERMLYYAGVSSRIGDVDGGTTTTDYMKEEMERGITIQSAVVTMQWSLDSADARTSTASHQHCPPPTTSSAKEQKESMPYKPTNGSSSVPHSYSMYLIDTPGHSDFTIEVERSVRVVDGVVALLDASAGVQAQSYTVLAQSVRHGVPLLAYLNKMDKPNANFFASVKSMEDKLKVEPVVLQLPLQGDCGEFLGVIDLLSLECVTFAGPHGEEVCRSPALPPPLYRSATEGAKVRTDTAAGITPTLSAAQQDRVREARHALLAQLTAVDDPLSECLIEALDATDGNETAAEQRIPAEVLHAAIRRILVTPPPASSNKSRREGRPRRILVPVLCGASRRNLGVQPLMDAICRYLPSPLERRIEGLTWQGAPTWQWPQVGSRFAGVPKHQQNNSRRSPHHGWVDRTGVTTSGAPPTALSVPSPLLLALAFKVSHTVNPLSGKREALVYLRILSGSLKGRGAGTGAPRIWNRTRRQHTNGESQPMEEVVQAVYILHGNTPMEVSELFTGEVGAVFLRHTFTGDTLTSTPHIPIQLEKNRKSGNAPEKAEAEDDEAVFLLEGIHAPPSVLSYAVEAATASQSLRLKEAVQELAREDPSLVFHVDEYGNLVLEGLGELHLEVALSRLRHEHELDCRLLRAMVAYRETLRMIHNDKGTSFETMTAGRHSLSRCIIVLVLRHNGVPYAQVKLSMEPLYQQPFGVDAPADENSSDACRGEDEAMLYNGEAVPVFRIAPQAIVCLNSNSSRKRQHPASSTASRPQQLLCVDAETRQHVREWRRALEEGFEAAMREWSRMGPLTGMPLHGIQLTMRHFRKLIGSGSASTTTFSNSNAYIMEESSGSSSSEDSGIAQSVPMDPKSIRAMAREALQDLFLLCRISDKSGQQSKKQSTRPVEKENRNALSPSKDAHQPDDNSFITGGAWLLESALLEPIMRVNVELTEPELLGEVVRLLSERQPLYIETYCSHPSASCSSSSAPQEHYAEDNSSASSLLLDAVEATVPLRRLTHFSTALRTASKGHASLSLRLSAYREVRDEAVRQQILRSRGIRV